MQNTEFDEAVDKHSINPGFQMFEKRVSGMFLGEILRQSLLSLISKSNLFSGQTSSPLSKQYGIDTSAMSTIASDTSTQLDKVRDVVTGTWEIANPSYEDLKAVRLVSNAIARRSARLAAVAVCAVSEQSGRFKDATEEKPIDIGADGSLVEFYPEYVDMCLAACDEILGQNASKRIRIALQKDGSGVGAALYESCPSLFPSYLLLAAVRCASMANDRCALQAKKQEEEGLIWEDDK